MVTSRPEAIIASIREFVQRESCTLERLAGRLGLPPESVRILASHVRGISFNVTTGKFSWRGVNPDSNPPASGPADDLQFLRRDGSGAGELSPRNEDSIGAGDKPDNPAPVESTGEELFGDDEDALALLGRRLRDAEFALHGMASLVSALEESVVRLETELAALKAK